MKKSSTLRINDKTRMAIKSDGTKIPVIDGKFTFVIQPNEEDIKNAIPGDHANCMYCLAYRRLYGSDLVWVTRSLAYVELKEKGGKPVLERFILTDPARVNVKDFDAEKDVTPEAVVFAAPRGSQRLDAKAAAYSRWASGKSRKAYLKGQKSGESKRKIPQPVSTLRDRATGKFQFQSKP